jgi:hypothetical protein
MSTNQKITTFDRRYIRENLATIKKVPLKEIPYPRSNSMYIKYKNEIKKIECFKDECFRLSQITPTKEDDYYVDLYFETKEMTQFCSELYSLLIGVYNVDRTTINTIFYIDEYFELYNMFIPNDEEAVEIIKNLIKLCIRHINAGISIHHFSNPRYVLEIVKHYIEINDFHYSHYFDKEMFEYALKNCSNIKVILKIFPAIGSYEVETGYGEWYSKYKERIVATKIQRRVLQWLYRPGGKFMKEAETHFYKVAISTAA